MWNDPSARPQFSLSAMDEAKFHSTLRVLRVDSLWDLLNPNPSHGHGLDEAEWDRKSCLSLSLGRHRISLHVLVGNPIGRRSFNNSWPLHLYVL